MSDHEHTQLVTALNRLGIGAVQSGPNTLGTFTLEVMGPPESFKRLLAVLLGEEELVRA